jgi:hypothetical protein
MKKLFERVKRIIVDPQEAIVSLKAEEVTIESFLREFLLPLGIVPAIATFLGWWSSYHYSFVKTLFVALFFYVLVVGSVWLTGYLLNILAPNFGATGNLIDGLKIAFIVWVPYFVACIINLLPRISILSVIAVFYGIYLFYTASEKMIGTPKEKNIPLTIIIGVLMLILWYIGRIIFFWGSI